MSNPASHCFDARTEPCAHLREWLEKFCAETHTSAHNTWQLTLMLEELFVNSVKHGYPGLKQNEVMSEWPVWIELMHNTEGLQVRYEDAAIEFNPLNNIQPPDYSGPAERWRIGGLGLALVAGIARNMQYERTANRNRLSLTLPASER